MLQNWQNRGVRGCSPPPSQKLLDPGHFDCRQDWLGHRATPTNPIIFAASLIHYLGGIHWLYIYTHTTGGLDVWPLHAYKRVASYLTLECRMIVEWNRKWQLALRHQMNERDDGQNQLHSNWKSLSNGTTVENHWNGAQANVGLSMSCQDPGPVISPHCGRGLGRQRCPKREVTSA